MAAVARVMAAAAFRIAAAALPHSSSPTRNMSAALMPARGHCFAPWPDHPHMAHIAGADLHIPEKAPAREERTGPRITMRERRRHGHCCCNVRYDARPPPRRQQHCRAWGTANGPRPDGKTTCSPGPLKDGHMDGLPDLTRRFRPTAGEERPKRLSRTRGSTAAPASSRRRACTRRSQCPLTISRHQCAGELPS